MDAILKFKEAAKEFQNSDIYKNLAMARKANDEDTELQNQIGEFNLVRMEINNEMEKPEQDEAKVAELNSRVTSLYDLVMNNERMVAYSKAKDEIENFMNYVNAILNDAINGDDPMATEEPQHSCDDSNCSSCAGCG